MVWQKRKRKFAVFDLAFPGIIRRKRKEGVCLKDDRPTPWMPEDQFDRELYPKEPQATNREEDSPAADDDWYWSEPDDFWVDEGMWPWPEPAPKVSKGPKRKPPEPQ